MHAAAKPLFTLLVCGATMPALANEIAFVDQFRNLSYAQTGNSTLTFQSAFLSASAQVSSQASASYNSGTLTIGDPDTGPSFALNSTDGGHSFSFQTQALPSQAAMDAQFPLSSTYTYALSNGTDSASTGIPVGANQYAGAQPMLTGSSFSALQGMDSSQALTLSFNPFDEVPGADSQFVFFSIYDYTTSTSLFPVSFAPRTTTGVTLDAGLLVPGHDYSFELIDSVRVNVPDADTDFQAQVAFDLRTSGMFTTSLPVPEPSTTALWLTGLLALARASRKGRAGRR
jgi:hypothetical protein